MKKKKTLSFALASLITLSLSGCASMVGESNVSSESSSSSSEETSLEPSSESSESSSSNEESIDESSEESSESDFYSEEPSGSSEETSLESSNESSESKSSSSNSESSSESSESSSSSEESIDESSLESSESDFSSEESTSSSEETSYESSSESESIEDGKLPDSVIKNYKKYDSTYSYDDFAVKQSSALTGREDDFIMGADISLYSAILESGAKYYNNKGKEESICKILKDSGVNTVRVRLFHDYTSSTGTPCGRLDLTRVLSMIKEAKSYGLKVLLDLHYSDTWADPTNQIVPDAWKNDTYSELLEHVYNYTKEVLNAIKGEDIALDYIQIGNETDYGMIKPFGDIDWDNQSASFDTLYEIMSKGCSATREVFPNCKIIIHTANGLYNWQDPNNENNFNSCEVFYYQELVNRGLDFDICGASFYSTYMISTKTKMSRVSDLINEYKTKVNKPVMAVETSYGFTYAWNDYTSNTFYTDDALDDYPVTFQGQADFLADLIDEIASAKDNNGAGVCYWGGEMIPNTDPDMRTSWGNQTLFTYEGIATPTLNVFSQCFPK